MSAEIKHIHDYKTTHDQKYLKRALKSAYDYCFSLAKSHYENFPVASSLLPKKHRPAIAAIYAFSRIADDFADEPEFQGVRLEKLREWETYLFDENPTHPVFVALQDTIRKYALPKKLFQDLLKAFQQDVTKSRYEDFHEVLDYCRFSANPIGRLVLHVFGQDSEINLKHSDAICTALQLTNFWQDIGVDLKKDRIYLPQKDLFRFHIQEKDLFEKEFSKSVVELVQYQVERTREIFLEGAELGKNLSGLLGVEIRLTWLTGMEILKKIESVDYQVVNQRPALQKSDYFKLFGKALFKSLYSKEVQKWQQSS